MTASLNKSLCSLYRRFNGQKHIEYNSSLQVYIDAANLTSRLLIC